MKNEWILGNEALRVAGPPATQGLVHSWPADHGSQPFTTTGQLRGGAHTRSRAGSCRLNLHLGLSGKCLPL